MAYDGKRNIYAGTTAGVLTRIDTVTGKVEKIAHLTAAGRLPALAVKNGILYAAGGMNGCTQLIRWDTRGERLEGYTNLRDPQTGCCPGRIHEMATDEDHRLYLGENDNHERSSYLWSVRLD